MVNFENIRIYLKSKAAVNVYTSVILKILTSFMYIILVPYAIRSIGAEKYGIAAFFLTMHGYMSLLDSGFTYALGLQYTRKLVGLNSEAQKVFFAAIPVYIALALVGLLVFFLFKGQLSIWAFNSVTYQSEMFIFGFILMVTVIDSMLNTVLQAHEKINLIASGRFLLDLVKVFGVVTLGYSHIDPEKIVWFVLLSTIVKLTFNFYFFNKIIPKIKIIIDFVLMRDIFKLALPSVGISICSLIMSMLDKFFVSGKISSAAFTSYSFAFDLTTKAYFLMYAVTTVIYPKLIKEHSKGKSLIRLVKVQLLSILLITLGYYLPLSLFSEYIVKVLLGADLMEPTASLIKICCLSAVLYLSFTVFESYLNSIGAVKRTLAIYVVGILSFLFFLDYFIGKYDLFGVAISVSSMFMVMIITAIVFIVSMNTKVSHDN